MRISKGLLVVAALLIVAGYSTQQAVSNSMGIIARSRAGCGGGGCHSSSSATTVTISSTATTFTVGQTYTFTITVKNPNEAGAGCDISIDNSAKLAVSGSGLQLAGGELTHTSPRSFGNTDSATWTFKYTPTKVGTNHIYAAGNAVNLNNDNSGDAYSTTTFTLNVVSASGPSISVPTAVAVTAPAGDSSTTIVTIKNKGTTALNINGYTLRSGTFFHLVDTSAHTIAAGDSAHVSVIFKPTSNGAFSDVLHVLSNDASTPNAAVTLNGTGTTPAGVSFGNTSAVALMVSPNPSQSGRFRIATTGISGLADVVIYDPAGRVQFSGEMQLDESASLDLSSLASGAYTLRIAPRDASQAVQVRRIVIAH